MQLNQRLCEIRNHSSSCAIANLELEFRLATDNADISSDGITALHQQYAQDLLKDKKFIFGKYTVTGNKISAFLFKGSVLYLPLSC